MKSAAYVPRYVPQRVTRLFPGSEVSSPPFCHFYLCLQYITVPQNRVCRKTQALRVLISFKRQNIGEGAVTFSYFVLMELCPLSSSVNSFQTPAIGLMTWRKSEGCLSSPSLCLRVSRASSAVQSQDLKDSY